MKSVLRSPETAAKPLRDIPGIRTPRPAAPAPPAVSVPLLADDLAVELACNVLAGSPPPVGPVLAGLQAAIYKLQVRGELSTRLAAWWANASQELKDRYMTGAVTGRWALLVHDPLRK